MYGCGKLACCVFLGGIKIWHNARCDAGILPQIIGGSRVLTQAQASMMPQNAGRKTQLCMKPPSPVSHWAQKTSVRVFARYNVFEASFTHDASHNEAWTYCHRGDLFSLSHQWATYQTLQCTMHCPPQWLRPGSCWTHVCCDGLSLNTCDWALLLHWGLFTSQVYASNMSSCGTATLFCFSSMFCTGQERYLSQAAAGCNSNHCSRRVHWRENSKNSHCSC